jgi:hypothetical protein
VLLAESITRKPVSTIAPTGWVLRIVAESESIAEDNECVFCSVNLPQRDDGFRLVSAALAQNARPATARARSNPDRMPAADR